MIRTSLKHNYIRVYDLKEEGKSSFSFGGNQGWFEDKEKKSSARENVIDGYGCGLISAYDITKYINGVYETSRETYMQDIVKLSRWPFHLFNHHGMSGFWLAFAMKIYCRGVRVRWGVRYSRLLETIKECLEDDTPITLSIGPALFHKKRRLTFYQKTEEKKVIHFTKANSAKAHFVTITGMEEYDDRIMLEISSWGEKYFIDFDEYIAFADKYDNHLFSNIMVVRKKGKWKAE